MSSSFRISLLYLLLIIPQHRNSPLPVMESWLKKDQDDGFVQRDMTSSLTGGDESFGSAHQTYQNSLIRKKKADNFGSPVPGPNYKSMFTKYDQNQLYEPNVFYKAHYMNKKFSLPNIQNDRSNFVYDSFENARVPYSKYLAETLDLKSSMAGPQDPNFSKMGNNKRSFLKGNLQFLNSRSELPSDSEGNLNSVEDFGRSSRWSMCKRLKARYAPNPFSNLPQPAIARDALNMDENMALQNEYLPVEAEQYGRQIRNGELKESSRPDGKTPQVFDENEYYEAEGNPVAADENLNMEEDDYNQILNEHAFMHKRDDTRQLQNYPKMPTSDVAQVVEDALKAPDSSRVYFSDSSPMEGVEEDTPSTRKTGVKTRDTKEDPDSESNSSLVWKLNTDLQAKELNKLMKNSQKALQEVQQFQQKLSYKSGEAGDSEGLKRPTRNEFAAKNDKIKLSFDEKRLKREDEDEQKNMKTGTDEGGGGEYEDEEGKGHKDEEEYYEDADLSTDETGSEMQKTSELNQKYVKRDAAKAAARSKNSEEKNDNDQDYELNLENAPVENSEKTKKSSYREREKTKKSTVRKGVKIWDEWGKWSPCSVTCGVGRSTRWRHCIGGGCAQGEKEAQIKRCTNPAC